MVTSSEHRTSGLVGDVDRVVGLMRVTTGFLCRSELSLWIWMVMHWTRIEVTGRERRAHLTSTSKTQDENARAG